MNDALTAKINDQINKELYSGYIYLGMAAYFEGENLPGFAHWMKRQAEEEVEHAMKMFTFLAERGAPITLDAIDGPTTEYDSVLGVFRAGLEHEQYVTGLINDLYESALAEKDHATAIFLQWFVTEQVEEEDSFGSMIEDLERVGDCGKALYMMDRAAASRE